MNVSPTWAVDESTASIMRMDTGVPLGTVACLATGATGSDLTCAGSGGAPGASTAGATGAGNVKVGEAAGAGASAAEVSFFGTSLRAMSRDGFAFGTGRETAGGSSIAVRERGL